MASGGAGVTTATRGIDRSTVLALAAMGVAVLVLANDFTALSVALPSIEREFDVGVDTAQWVINAYALVFGVLIVVGGRAADVFGRKRVFVVGSVIFAGFSVLGGAAQNVGWLIACRALMGVGGAMMWPAILGMTFAALPKERAGLAGGLVLGAAGIGNAIGPLFGGLLTDALSWRWIFFVNLPIAAFGILVTLLEIHQDEELDPERRFDYAGIALLSGGLVSLLLALDLAPDDGWGDPTVVVLLALSAVLLAAFALAERRAGAGGLVPAAVVRNRAFTSACLAVLLMSAVFFAALLYLPQFMIKVLGYSPVRAGAGLLPLMGTFAVVSFVAGPLYRRLSPKLIVSAGAACCAVGMFLLSLIEVDSGYGSLVGGMLVLGAGIGLFYSTITTVAVTALDPSQASLAGGIVYMCQIAGGSVGLAVNTAIVAAAGGLATSADLVDGINTAFLVDAILAILALAVAGLFVGGTVHRHERHAAALWHHHARL
jgi:EmrB/QacA subfamily drug resistance transporter